ncbi:MAG TPA: AmmeMemoRadiSam system protein B [Thermoanaerobaculia bacterium]
MTVRLPAVAGRFYEGSPERLTAQIEACLATNLPVARHDSFIAGAVPHAGLMYSGHVAAAFYSALKLPERFIILCPNHTGAGHFAAINSEGTWITPLGNVPVDADLARALMAETPLLVEDSSAHAQEHSLEVQLPFLQRLAGTFTFVPICLASHRFEYAEEIGLAIARVIRKQSEPVAILASTDLNHYEEQQTTLRKDQVAIDRILDLDPHGLWTSVAEHGISMCGFIPTTTMLIAAKALGASSATLLKHATSGDINGDYSQVVGYAAVVVR